MSKDFQRGDSHGRFSSPKGTANPHGLSPEWSITGKTDLAMRCLEGNVAILEENIGGDVFLTAAQATVKLISDGHAEWITMTVKLKDEREILKRELKAQEVVNSEQKAKLEELRAAFRTTRDGLVETNRRSPDSPELFNR